MQVIELGENVQSVDDAVVELDAVLDSYEDDALLVMQSGRTARWQCL